MNKYNKGILFVLMASLLWSTGGLAIKLNNLLPIQIAFFRCLIGGLVLLPFIKLKGIKLTWPLIGLFFTYSYTIITFVLSTKLTSAGNTIALQSTAPLWLFVYLIIITKKFYKTKVMSIAIIIIGIGLFLMEPNSGTSKLGNLLAISTGMAFGGLTYFLSLNHKISSISIISICNLIAAIILLPFILSTSFENGISVSDAATLLFLCIFQIAIAYLIFQKGLKYIDPLNASIYALLEPVLNPVWVFIFYGELQTIYGIIGTTIILIGVLINLVQSKQKRKLIKTALI